MQALAPPHIIVEAGACVSLCGSGPVVQQSAPTDTSSSASPSKEKRVREDGKILKLLYPQGGYPREILEGFHLVQEGNEAYARNDFSAALGFYEKAINVAYRAAVELQNERDRAFKSEEQRVLPSPSSSSSSPTQVPRGLEWLVRARRHEALCKLELKDIDGAMLAAQSSCNLSRNTSGESFLTLAQIYKIEGEPEGEAQALEKVLSLWDDEAQLDFAQKNQRRLAALRLQKLQKELS
jgi:tetratricopeptide (TPR) repeat protein